MTKVRDVAEGIERDLRLDAEAMKEPFKAGVSTGIEELAFRLGRDSEVIGLCPTCRGRRYVTGAEDFPGGDEGYDVTCSPCPDCGPVWVIEPAAWEAAKTAIKEGYRRLWGREQDASIGAIGLHDSPDIVAETAETILQALLPGARVAKEVVECEEAGRLGIGMVDGVALGVDVIPGDDIAILEDTRVARTATSCDKEELC